MKKIDVGQTIGILANIGVVAGIILLALEIKQNNDLLESEILFNHTQIRMDIGTPLHNNSHLAEIVVKKNAGEQLTSVEARMLADWYNSTFTAWEWEFREYRNGKLKALPIKAYKRSLTGNDANGDVIYPGLLDHWSFAKDWYSEDFVVWMEQNVIDKR